MSDAGVNIPQKESLLESFFYEISAYLVPGCAFVGYFLGPSWGQSLDNAVGFLAFFAVSLIVGMVISTLTFMIFNQNLPLYYFNHASGFRVLLRKRSARGWLRWRVHSQLKSYPQSVRDCIRSDLARFLRDAEGAPIFDLEDSKTWEDENLRKHQTFIRTSLLYIARRRGGKSSSIGRYYDRIGLARNTGVSLLLIALLEMTMQLEAVDSMRAVLGPPYLLVAAALLLLMYSRIQAEWHAERLLILFYLSNVDGRQKEPKN